MVSPGCSLWTRPVGEIFTLGTTDATGTVKFAARNAPSGTYVTTITSISAPGLTSDGSTPANSFNKGTDSVPKSFCAAPAGVNLAAQNDAFARARNVKLQHSNGLFDIEDVVGHGIALGADGNPVIEVYLAKENAASRGKIPAKLDGVPVQVKITGPFIAH